MNTVISPIPPYLIGRESLPKSLNLDFWVNPTLIERVFKKKTDWSEGRVYQKVQFCTFE